MRQSARLNILASGAAAGIIVLGIGRFAFTPLLPPMQAEIGFSDTTAGLMASFNLFGYLAGAMSVGWMPLSARSLSYRLGIMTALICMGLMPLPLGVVGWTAVRFAAGLSSGLVFILSTAFVLEGGAADGRTGAALHFAGIGLGIALSGVVVSIEPEWRIAWLKLMTISIFLAIPSWRLADHAAPRHTASVAHRNGGGQRRLLGLLVIAYGLEGLGYIVSGTFLVSLLRRLPETADLGSLAWVLVGLTAAPSTLLWGWVGRRTGAWAALSIAYAVQAVGIALPLLGQPGAALAAAILYGGTFTGIVGVSLTLAATLQPGQMGKAAARLTVLYGIGQVIGPVLAGALTGDKGNFTLPLAGAASLVAIAGALSFLGHVLASRMTAQVSTP